MGTQLCLSQTDCVCAGAKDIHGLYTNTADVDCSVCKTDLWLSAVVSRAAPGGAVCPAHAATLLGCPEEKTLLFRYTFEELEAMVATAVDLIDGAAEAVEFAKQRRQLWKVSAVQQSTTSSDR